MTHDPIILTLAAVGLALLAEALCFKAWTALDALAKRQEAERLADIEWARAANAHVIRKAEARHAARTPLRAAQRDLTHRSLRLATGRGA